MTDMLPVMVPIGLGAGAIDTSAATTSRSCWAPGPQ